MRSCGGSAAQTAQLELEVERVGREGDRDLEGDLSRDDEIGEVLVEGLRAVLRASFGEGLAEFSESAGVGEDVADWRAHEEDFGGEDAAVAVRARQETLRDGGSEEFRELESGGVLMIRREVGEQGADGSSGVRSAHLADDETPLLSGANGELGQFTSREVADDDDVRVLLHRGTDAGRVGIGVDADLALGHGALLVLVQELDRAFDGDHVPTPRCVHVEMVDEGSDGAGASGPRSAGDQDESEIGEGDAPERGGKSDGFEGREHVRNDAHHDHEAGALLEDAQAEAADAGRTPRAGVVLYIVNERRAGGGGEDVRRHLVGVHGREDGRVERDELSGDASEDDVAGADVDVGRLPTDRLDEDLAESFDLGCRSRGPETPFIARIPGGCFCFSDVVGLECSVHGSRARWSTNRRRADEGRRVGRPSETNGATKLRRFGLNGLVAHNRRPYG